MKLSFPARFPRRPRGNSQPKPQNSRSIQLKVVPPKSAPVPGLLDAAGRRCGAGQALVVGGVASSLRLRRLLDERLAKLRSPVRAMFGQPCYSGDNAAGVAWIGMKNYRNR